MPPPFCVFAKYMRYIICRPSKSFTNQISFFLLFCTAILLLSPYIFLQHPIFDPIARPNSLVFFPFPSLTLALSPAALCCVCASFYLFFKPTPRCGSRIGDFAIDLGQIKAQLTGAAISPHVDVRIFMFLFLFIYLRCDHFFSSQIFNPLLSPTLPTTLAAGI